MCVICELDQFILKIEYLKELVTNSIVHTLGTGIYYTETKSHKMACERKEMIFL
jgi:hypothetical protein